MFAYKYLLRDELINCLHLKLKKFQLTEKHEFHECDA